MSSFTERKEILEDFIGESLDALADLDNSLIHLEQHMEHGDLLDGSVVDKIFLIFHSIKGSASYLKLKAITELTHELESLLDLIRKHRLSLMPYHIELFYQAGDRLKKMIELEDGKQEQPSLSGDLRPLLERLRAAIRGEAVGVVVEDIDGEIDSLTMLIKDLLQEGIAKPNIRESLARHLHRLPPFLEAMGQAYLGALARTLGHLIAKVGEAKAESLHEVLVKLINTIKAARRMPRGQDQQVAEREELTNQIADLIRDNLDREGRGQLGKLMVDLGLIDDGEMIADWRVATDDGDLETALALQQRPLGEILVEDMHLSRARVELGLEIQKAHRRESEKDQFGRRNIRVGVDKLDQLGNLVGELVIAENMVSHHMGSSAEGELRQAGNHLDRITRDIQDLVMSLRMVPLGPTMSKMRRVIRDVSHKLGKPVDMVTTGDDTTIDRDVVDSLATPLTHILRNAVDHGLESEEERRARGKSAVGTIRLEASQQGGEIKISIQDDGRGIDREKVRRRAVAQGLIANEHAFDRDEDLLALIFQPGFSTADKVSEVSGRGVGMDVVKKYIDEVNGTLDISSQPGEGTRITLNIPMTLTIIEGMQVRVGDMYLTIPLLNIREHLSCSLQNYSRDVNGQEHILIRGRLVPVTRLADYFNMLEESVIGEHSALVVVESGPRIGALLVDEIMGQCQTVIKRISRFFGKVRGVSGFSILSNGGITLILDVNTVLDLSRT